MSRALVSGNRMHAKVCFIQIQLHTYKSMVPRTWTSNPQKYVAWEAQGYFMTWLGIFVHFLAENYLIKSQCGMFLLLCCLHFFWCRSQPWPHTQQEAAGQWQCRQESRAGCHRIPALVLLPTPGALWLWGGGCSHGKVLGEVMGRGLLGAPHLAAGSLIFRTTLWSCLIFLGGSWGRAGSGGSLWGQGMAGLRSPSLEAYPCAGQPLAHGGTCSTKVDTNCQPLKAREFLPSFTLRHSASGVNETFSVLQRAGCVQIRWWLTKVNR